MALSVLDDLGASELLDPKLWMEGAKSAGGGAAAIIVSNILASKLPVISHQKPMIKSVFKAALSILAGSMGRRVVGDSFASGIVGGGAGAALAEIVSAFLPASLLPGGAGVSYLGALTPEERALLSDVPGEFGEVSVEEPPGLSEVGVEGTDFGTHAVHGMDAISISALG